VAATVLKREGRIECRGVGKAFGEEWARTVVVQDASFAVEQGQLNVVIGPSGCGKTTLISLVAGYEQPTAGEIIIDGQRITGPGPDRLVVFQETALFPWMTSLENVTFGPIVRGMSARAARDEAHRLLERVGLKGFEDRYPSQLSGGMQRRCELARALINQPRLLVCDEPTSALDAGSGQTVMELIKQVAVQPGRAVIVVTHDSRIFGFGDRMVEMSDGKIVKQN